MKLLMKAASLLLGFGVILSSGIALADDVVSIGVLPGSSINVRGTVLALGQDPPASTLNNALIADDGTLFVAQSDISFEPIDVAVFTGFGTFVVHVELRAQSDLIGAYDRNTGSFAAAADADIKLTSNVPGFNNNRCIIPTTTWKLSTDDLGGSLFSGGNGTVVDNSFVVNAIPFGACGGFFPDYATALNNALRLPSLTPGNNTLILVIRMDPPLAP